MRHKRSFRPFVESLEDRCVPATFVVSSTADSGIGSLRAAIVNSNMTPGANTIKFAIAPGNLQIALSSALPQITNQVTIDATTQPGYKGTPLVLLDGFQLAPGQDGLSFIGAASNGSKVQGLAISRFFYGIHLQSANNFITGDYLEADAAGLYIDGSSVNANGNTVGGTTAASQNLLSANSFYGVAIGGVGAVSNVVAGNTIGTDISGNTAMANGFDGVFIFNAAAKNIIGGLTNGRNIISGNTKNGVEIAGTNGGTGNTVENNFIGVKANGTAALGNGIDGVLLNGAPNNTIGGLGLPNLPGNQAVGGNIISGNGLNGVEITLATGDANIVEGNYIGTDLTGTMAIGNGFAGVDINSTAILNLIGGFNGNFAQPRNVISGNGVIGIRITDVGTTSNRIQSNYIGTNAAGTAAIANTFDGVLITSGAAKNLVGGQTGFGNTISGNGRNGVYLYSPTTTLNDVQGNFIGLNFNGSGGVGNKGDGVQLSNGANNNTIGGVVTLALQIANTISGNGLYGVEISDTGTTANSIQGNAIGTTAGATLKIGNQAGVFIHNKATSNTIGGTLGGAANSIAGNTYGIVFADSGTTANQVQGNFIGTNGILNTANIGNAIDGIFVGTQAAGNVIGGVVTGVRNVISANGRNGITITDPGTVGTVVASNYIGTTNNGLGNFGNSNDGIAIVNGVTNTTIGGSAATSNTISGNTVAGIDISDPTTNKINVQGNFIGTSAPGNDVQSILITGNPTGGFFSLSLNGQTAGGIPFNATAVQVAAAIQTLFSNGEVVRGTGGPLPNGGVVLTFSGTLTNLPVNTIVANSSLLTGGSNPMVIVNHTRIGGNASTAVRNGIGILLEKGTNTDQIGGNAPGQGNIISGNVNAGVQIQGLGTNVNLLLGNNIGVDNTSVNPIPNGTDGVLIQGGAQQNTIGGIGRGAFNVISGNAQTGVHITGVGTINNLVEGDYVGNSAPVNDVQTIQINGAPTSGNFQLAFGSQLTATIAFNATAATVQAALAALPGIGLGNVAVFGGPFPGVPMVVTFQGSLQSSPVPVLAVVNNTLNNNAGVSISHTTFGSTNIAAGNQLYGVEISGGATSDTIGGDITTGSRNFISGNAVSGVILTDAGTTTNLVAGNLIGTNAALNDVQTLAIFGNPTGGSYTITGSASTQTLSLFSTAAAIQAAVAAAIGDPVVTDILVEGGPLPGTPVTLTFQGTLANMNIPLLTANGAGLTGGSNVAVVISHTVTGQVATTQIANQDGVEILNGASNNSIGGVSFDQFGNVTNQAANVISGNDRFGVLIGGAGTRFNSLRRNVIGALQDGLTYAQQIAPGVYDNFAPTPTPLGNGSHGVFITDNASSNTIGGVNGGQQGVSNRNVIANNGTNGKDGNGVLIGDDPGIQFNSLAGAGNGVVGGNLIFQNLGLAIDLGPNDGDTPNNFFGHIGPNSFQNEIVFAANGSTQNVNMDSWTDNNESPGLDNPPFNPKSAGLYSGIQTVGTINTTPNTQIRLEFYGLPAGGGIVYLGNEPTPGEESFSNGHSLIVTTDANGFATFVYQAAPTAIGGSELSLQNGDQLAVVATNLGTNDTSEYAVFQLGFFGGGAPLP